MAARDVVLALLGTVLLVTPLQAQNRPGSAGHGGGAAPHAASQGVPHGGAGGGGVHAPMIFHGGPRGPAQWSEFHHDTAAARVAPHRFGATNLPRPNSWAGNPRSFDLARWQGGNWQHMSHGGRLGWWWVVGPDWYYFDEPVYPYPDLYTPMSQPLGWWYWCDPLQEYYPYVTSCPVPWESVMPRD